MTARIRPYQHFSVPMRWHYTGWADTRVKELNDV